MTDESSPTDLTDLMTLLSHNTIDQLANLPAQDLDKIIAYQRKQRIQREAGGKTKRAKGEGPTIDIKALMGRPQKGPEPIPTQPSPPQPTSKPTSAPPPVGAGIRRFL